MKIIHTSDWHLGALLYEQSRFDEHVKFFSWLKELMAREKPDALVVAGDVFDTYSPPNASLEQYYSLIGEIYKESLCGMVIVIGGNHDSPAQLDSPDKVLSHLNTRVVGASDPEKEIIILREKNGRPGLAVGAVPYLRDADLRHFVGGESFTESSERLRAGFRKHYVELAEKLRGIAGADVPMVLTGHCCLSKSKVSDEISERARQIGNLGEIPFELLPDADYYALGHLHLAQAPFEDRPCRYSGSPLPMSFGEAGQPKSVAVVEFNGRAEVRLEQVPCFQTLEQIKGTPEAIEARVKQLMSESADAWLEVHVTEFEGDLSEFWNRLPSAAEGGKLKILSTHDSRPRKEWNARAGEEISLEISRPDEVFEMRLKDEGLSEEERAEFASMFKEAMNTVVLEGIEEEAER